MGQGNFSMTMGSLNHMSWPWLEPEARPHLEGLFSLLKSLVQEHFYGGKPLLHRLLIFKDFVVILTKFF